MFIHVYLDEDVSVLVAALLRSRGFAATTTVQAGRLGASDDDQLEYAASHRMAILTHNRSDFERLAVEYLATGRTHSGIIAASRHPPHEIVRRLFEILNTVTADEMVNQLRYL